MSKNVVMRLAMLVTSCTLSLHENSCCPNGTGTVSSSIIQVFLFDVTVLSQKCLRRLCLSFIFPSAAEIKKRRFTVKYMYSSISIKDVIAEAHRCPLPCKWNVNKSRKGGKQAIAFEAYLDPPPDRRAAGHFSVFFCLRCQNPQRREIMNTQTENKESFNSVLSCWGKSQCGALL